MITIVVSNNIDSIKNKQNSYLFLYMKVKRIDKGINPSYASQIYFSRDYLLKGFNIGGRWYDSIDGDQSQHL